MAVVFYYKDMLEKVRMQRTQQFSALVCYHSRPQSLRSFWPAAGIERLWEQPFQACAIDADYVRPDGQNSVISFVISKWLLPELPIPAAGQKDRRLWGRECFVTERTQLNAAYAQLFEKLRPIVFAETYRFLTI